MAIGFIGSSNSGAGNVAAATVTVSAPADVVSTDVLILSMMEGRNGTTAIGSYAPPTGWTRIGSQVQTTSFDRSGLECYVAQANVANFGFTRSGTIDYAGWRCAAFSGVDLTTPIDVTGTGVASANTGLVVAGALTIVTDQAWHLIGAVDWNAATTTATGFNVLSNYDARFLYNTTPKSTGSTGNVTVNSSNGANGQMLLVLPFALRPAGAGGGPTNRASGAETAAVFRANLDDMRRETGAWEVRRELLRKRAA